MFGSEVYFFSDYSTKLGAKNSARKFPEIHDRCLEDSGVPTTTNHGMPHKWIWDCESGVSAFQIMNKIKKMIEICFSGDPQKFKSRIVIFGCLNDLDTWATSRDEPLPYRYAKRAMDIRNYFSLFERGRIIWLGPGSEKILEF